MPKNTENTGSWLQFVTNSKGGYILSYPFTKKEALSGFSITFHSILQQYSFLAQRLNVTCHIMTSEEDCSALAYRGTGWRESS